MEQAYTRPSNVTDGISTIGFIQEEGNITKVAYWNEEYRSQIWGGALGD